MSFSKITDEMRAGKGNVGQPDTPNLTTTKMQEKMDELGNMALDFINTHIDELELTTAAANIGANVPTGLSANPNIESILAAIALVANESSSIKHSHANKTTLDAITDTVKDGYDLVAQVLSGISSVQTVITSSDTALPTCKAVETFVNNLNISEKVFNEAYPLGSVYMTTSNLNPYALLGYGTWTEIGTADSYGVRRYVRAS